MDAQSLIVELGNRLGFALALSNENTCAIAFDDEHVDFELSGNAFFMIADVGRLVDNTFALKRFLNANYLGNETGGATLGMRNDMVTLHRQLTVPAKYEDFEQALEAFVTTLRYWKEWLQEPHETNTHETASTDHFSMPNMIRI